MSDLGSNIFETVSSRVTEVTNSRNAQSSLLTAARNLSTTLPLVGKKFIEYRVGQSTGTVYCRVYMAKSEVDEHMVHKEPEPGAFAASGRSHPIHAVIGRVAGLFE